MTSSLFNQRSHHLAQDMPRAMQPLTPPLSGCSEGQPYSPSLMNATSQQLEAFLDTLQPSQWLSPGAIAWNDWDMIVDGYQASTGLLTT
jgi:hypothetical protein